MYQVIEKRFIRINFKFVFMYISPLYLFLYCIYFILFILFSRLKS